MQAPPDPIELEQVRAIASELVPHHQAIGTLLVEYVPGRLTLGLRWREDLVEDPETGALANSAIAAVLDHAAGLAVITRIGRSTIGKAATLDMRVDYLRSSVRGLTVHARAECHALNDEVAYVRGEAWHPDEPEHRLATAAIAYVLAGAGRPMEVKR
jgi:acyl-coenzyme A thioesterase PaaI-like protein